MPSTSDQDRWTAVTFGINPDLDPTKYDGPLAREAAQSQAAPSPQGAAQTVPRAQAVQALTTYFQKVLSDSGRQTLVVNDAMRTAVQRMALAPDGTPDRALAMGLMDVLSAKAGPGDPAGLAAAVGKKLPDTLPPAAVQQLANAATKDPKDTGAKSLGDAVGKGLADQLAPALKKLPLPKDIQEKLVELARKGGAEGLSKGVEKIIGVLPLDDKVKAAVTAVIQAVLKQGSGPAETPPDPPANRAEPPPTHNAGEPPAPKGEVIIKSPEIPWDFPSPKPPPKQPAPQEPAAADDAKVAAAIAAVADDALIPASVKGKPEADGYPMAKEFARQLAEAIGKAQKAKQRSVTMPVVHPPYPSADEQAAALKALTDIAASIGAAMPNGGAPVQEVTVSIAAREEGKMPWTRTVKLAPP